MKGPGPYLIESCSRLPASVRLAIRIQRLMTLPVIVASAAITGYRDELRHMRGADAIYLGPGK